MNALTNGSGKEFLVENLLSRKPTNFGLKKDESILCHDVSNDKPSQVTDMSMPTRDEFDAKLQAVEARMDTRIANIEAKIDVFLARMNERDRALEERDKKLTLIAEKERTARQQALDERDKRLEQLVQRANLAAEEAKGIKRHFWASVAAQFAGVAVILVGAFFANQQSMIGIAQITNSIYQQNQNTYQTKSPK